MDLYNRLSTKPATTNYLYNIALKKKILYVETPKVACTQIKRMLQRLEAGPSEILPKNIHDKEQSPLASPSNLGGEFFKVLYGDYFRLIFVRNPITRILSCYLDKFVKNKWEKSRRLPELGFDPEHELTFLEFLTCISKQNPTEMDVHWMPQTSILSLDSVKYDFVGRFENFSEDFERVHRRLGMEYTVCKETRKHRTNASDLVREFYNEKELRVLKSIYMEDFVRLMYSDDIQLT